jgi:hypothetical protein
MFTGIVEEVGKVRAARPGQLTIAAQRVLEETKLGDSIAVNGVCLTVTALSTDSFSVDVMPETLRRTNLGTLRPGDGVNLERPLADTAAHQPWDAAPWRWGESGAPTGDGRPFWWALCSGAYRWRGPIALGGAGGGGSSLRIRGRSRDNKLHS